MLDARAIHRLMERRQFAIQTGTDVGFLFEYWHGPFSQQIWKCMSVEIDYRHAHYSPTSSFLSPPRNKPLSKLSQIAPQKPRQLLTLLTS